VNILPITSTSTSTGSVTFGQSSYFFTSSSCTSGSTVGQVFATSTGQTYTYSLSGGSSYYSINPSTGIIQVLSQPPSGTQTFTVLATSNTGQSGSVPVTITSSCTGSSTGVTFGQTTYSLFLSSCTTGSFVGQISAFSTTGGQSRNRCLWSAIRLIA
jgi:hypothetical protein